jgi:hypothetical protein
MSKEIGSDLRWCSPRTISISTRCSPGHDGNPYPGTVATLLGRKDVPDAAKRKMPLDNSLNFYQMDKLKLGRRGMPVARPEPEEARRATGTGTISAR